MSRRGKAIIVDIDGTLAMRTERGPYDWDRVSEDTPNRPIVEIVNALQVSMGPTVSVVFVSGRKNVCRMKTLEWLKRFMLNESPWSLHMRGDTDNREDAVMKEELYREHIEPEFDVIAVFDDRQQVVDMWRSLGLTVLQVAPGDF
jgi:hypothetical protein